MLNKLSICTVLILTCHMLMAKEGARHAGKDDTRQITTVFSDTMSGDFLPPKLIKTTNQFEFPLDWDVENHWSNENTMMQYSERFLFP